VFCWQREALAGMMSGFSNSCAQTDPKLAANRTNRKYRQICITQLAAERSSSGGAGGDTQPAPDEASCEKRYPALTCNELFDCVR